MLGRLGWTEYQGRATCMHIDGPAIRLGCHKSLLHIYKLLGTSGVQAARGMEAHCLPVGLWYIGKSKA